MCVCVCVCCSLALHLARSGLTLFVCCCSPWDQRLAVGDQRAVLQRDHSWPRVVALRGFEPAGCPAVQHAGPLLTLPRAGGLFKLELFLPEDYPMAAPKVSPS